MPSAIKLDDGGNGSQESGAWVVPELIVWLDEEEEAADDEVVTDDVVADDDEILALAGLLYAFSVLVIFLVLAALYESWTIPMSVMLALPLGVIGSVAAATWRGLPSDVYFQIGLLTILGLTTKNAILIVQFARTRVDEGMRLTAATLEGAKLRLRPIVMTSLAFGFGVLPLALASGAGAGAQRAIGIGVLGGVVTSTFLVTIFAPLFYVMIYKALGKHRKRVTMKHTVENGSGGTVA